MATARLNPVRREYVTVLPGQAGAASVSTLAGSGVFQTENWYLGGLLNPRRFGASNPTTNYPFQGWVLDVYAFADVPGQIEIYGAATQVAATSYRLLQIVIVGASQAKIIQGFRIPTPYGYAAYRNGTTGQSTFEFAALIRAQ